jgi:signal transduction histidine kinase
VDLQDDGIGLPAHTQDSVGNGLRNMRKRILTLGGTLGTESSMGLPGDLTGTRIRFSVPLDGGTPNQRSIGRFSGVTDLRTR